MNFTIASDYVADPHHFVTGTAWVLTPVKSWYLLMNSDGQSHPWFAVPLGSASDHLDLRVLMIYVAVFCTAVGVAYANRRFADSRIQPTQLRLPLPPYLLSLWPRVQRIESSISLVLWRLIYDIIIVQLTFPSRWRDRHSGRISIGVSRARARRKARRMP